MLPDGRRPSVRPPATAPGPDLGAEPRVPFSLTPKDAGAVAVVAHFLTHAVVG